MKIAGQYHLMPDGYLPYLVNAATGRMLPGSSLDDTTMGPSFKTAAEAEQWLRSELAVRGQSGAEIRDVTCREKCGPTCCGGSAVYGLGAQ